MNTQDIERLETVRIKLAEMENAKMTDNETLLVGTLGWLRGYTKTWHTQATQEMDIQDNEKLSFCCELPITDDKFCSACGENQ